MPIVLNTEEAAFVARVHDYCVSGLNQPEMAARERMSISGLRDKLRRCGLEIEAMTERALVRVKTTQRYEDLLQRQQQAL